MLREREYGRCAASAILSTTFYMGSWFFFCLLICLFCFSFQAPKGFKAQSCGLEGARRSPGLQDGKTEALGLRSRYHG